MDSFTGKTPRTFVRGLTLVRLQLFSGNACVPGAFLHSLHGTPRPMENRWQGVILYTLPTHCTQAMQMFHFAPISGSKAHAVFLLTYNVVWIGTTEAMPGHILIERPTKHR